MGLFSLRAFLIAGGEEADIPTGAEKQVVSMGLFSRSQLSFFFFKSINTISWEYRISPGSKTGILNLSTTVIFGG
jgi:hypothetical protein